MTSLTSYGMDSLLNDFFNYNNLVFKSSTNDSFPPTDILVDEKEGKLIFRFAIAGWKSENISIEVDPEGNILMVSGTREKTDGCETHRAIRRKISWKDFSVKYALPINYNIDTPEVSFNEGLLQITFAKDQSKLPHKIPIG